MTGEQLTWIKPERSMSTENNMIVIELLIQLTKCITKNQLFSQQTDAEIQCHNRSDSERKQQHEVLLPTLLLEQQLHSE
ncbi:unnamed protein product [Rotaria magnacalcarata]